MGSVPAAASLTLLIQRLTEVKKPLLEHLQPSTSAGKRALLERMEVGLQERVSSQKIASGHRRAHNRPRKHLERLLRLEEEIRRERDEIQWTDAEIDWFINQEEMLPSSKEDNDQMDVD
jgi:hypothetical protein